MDGKKSRFTGHGFADGDFTPLERAQIRELVREMIESYVHIEPEVLDKIKSAATIISAVVIIGRIATIVAPIGAAIGVMLAMKGL
ncbi:MAG: hypothetical protein IT552_12370 [Sphingomonadaceae bacterium]|nr:hypothetical protein [Sphingomonadaceae bacterium]